MSPTSLNLLTQARKLPVMGCVDMAQVTFEKETLGVAPLRVASSNALKNLGL